MFDCTHEYILLMRSLVLSVLPLPLYTSSDKKLVCLGYVGVDAAYIGMPFIQIFDIIEPSLYEKHRLVPVRMRIAGF